MQALSRKFGMGTEPVALANREAAMIHAGPPARGLTTVEARPVRRRLEDGC